MYKIFFNDFLRVNIIIFEPRVRVLFWKYLKEARERERARINTPNPNLRPSHPSLFFSLTHETLSTKV